MALVKEEFDTLGNAVFHDDGGELYATFPVNNHHETAKIRSRDFRLWLNSLYFQKYHHNPGPHAMNL